MSYMIRIPPEIALSVFVIHVAFIYGGGEDSCKVSLNVQAMHNGYGGHVETDYGAEFTEGGKEG